MTKFLDLFLFFMSVFLLISSFEMDLTFFGMVFGGFLWSCSTFKLGLQGPKWRLNTGIFSKVMIDISLNYYAIFTDERSTEHKLNSAELSWAPRKKFATLRPSNAIQFRKIVPRHENQEKSVWLPRSSFLHCII